MIVRDARALIKAQEMADARVKAGRMTPEDAAEFVSLFNPRDKTQKTAGQPSAHGINSAPRKAPGMYKIEKEVPLTKRKYGAEIREPLVYPFVYMDVGDSFLIPAKTEDEFRSARNRADVALHTHHTQGRRGKFTSRKVEDGIRVWRIE